MSELTDGFSAESVFELNRVLQDGKKLREQGITLPGFEGVGGESGLSAYQIWLNEGNNGTVSDFLASLKGAKGDQGGQGPQGPQGPQGAMGVSNYVTVFYNGTAWGTQPDLVAGQRYLFDSVAHPGAPAPAPRAEYIGGSWPIHFWDPYPNEQL